MFDDISRSLLYELRAVDSGVLLHARVIALDLFFLWTKGSSGIKKSRRLVELVED